MDQINNEENKLPEQVEVADIQFRPGQKIYYFDPMGKSLRLGDHVIIDTARGPEFGICMGANHRIAASEVVTPLRSVIRLATAQDERIVEENRAKEKRAHAVCLQKIEEQGLDMQLVSAECAFDGSKILFFFTADERVDFRELVKSLAAVFHTRIELRQIGVRDKAKMVGGLGICGRPFCCASFLDDFQPVSIKMAKTQSLSLNPTKISGTCGRLMCCLKYEQDAYEDLLRNTPKEESFVDTPEGRGIVTEVSLLRQKVKVRLEKDPDTISRFAVADIAVLRNGKPKKTDEPIPDDWAPISGSGKPHPKTSDAEPDSLEPIRFRYREEQIVEQAAQPVPEETPKAEKSGRNRRHKNANRQKPEPSEAQKTPEPKNAEPPKPRTEKPQPAPEQNDAPSDAQNKPRNNRRRNYYHRRKPKQNDANS